MIERGLAGLQLASALQEGERSMHEATLNKEYSKTCSFGKANNTFD